MNEEEFKQKIKDAVTKVRQTCPLVPSITNTVTINFVANAQLAVGGSAAMVYMPDEGESMADFGNAMYINMGTILPVYEESLPRTARALWSQGKPWVLDPVGIGAGELRTNILSEFRLMPPTVVRGNASEIIALAKLWHLDAGVESHVRGVDATDSVQDALTAAKNIAELIEGAVAVSGAKDLVTDGQTVIQSEGGSELFTKVTGSGCSLGGVTAVYAAVADPLTAALTAVQIYNAAGSLAAKTAKGPGSFERDFIDALYNISAEDVANNPFTMVEN